MKLGTLRRLGLLSTLYFSQGVPYGFFTLVVPVLMRNAGMSLPQIGAANLLAAPWMLKFLWAPLVDRTPDGALGLGRRKAWILPLQGLAVLILASLAFLDPATVLGLLLAASFLTNAVAATQDVASDGLAVELLEPEERGYGNGVQVAAYQIGMVVGGGAILVGHETLGWTATFLVMAGVLALATLPILLHREATLPTRAAATPSALTDLSTAITRPGMGRWLLLIGLYKVGEALAKGMTRPYLVDSGMDLQRIAVLVGMGGTTGGILGALLGGMGIHLLGRRRAVLIFGLTQSLAVAAWALPSLVGPSVGLWWALCVAEPFCSGLATATAFTLMMDACRREQGQSGVDYTLQASAFVIATGVAAALSGLVAQHVGYTAHFALAGLLSLAGAVLLARNLDRAPREDAAAGGLSLKQGRPHPQEHA